MRVLIFCSVVVFFTCGCHSPKGPNLRNIDDRLAGLSMEPIRVKVVTVVQPLQTLVGFYYGYTIVYNEETKKYFLTSVFRDPPLKPGDWVTIYPIWVERKMAKLAITDLIPSLPLIPP